mmetsp:Transcript_50622/g.153990  ORF Transcript_50622/g.153990 Transcript_50622/m.153990 type:complete len:229 (-) Transcript_50622:240-926(-)
MAATSSPESSKSKTPKNSRSRSGLDVVVTTPRPDCKDQRSRTCAAVLPKRWAARSTCSSTGPSRSCSCDNGPSGQYAVTRTSRSWHQRSSPGCCKYGCASTWLHTGLIRASAKISSKSQIRQLDTPIARTNFLSTKSSILLQTSNSFISNGVPSGLNGAWTRYRSKYSSPMRSRLCRHMASTPGSSTLMTLLVMNNSDRGVSVRRNQSQMALPDTASLAYISASSMWR